jgi:hypothetical protein
VHFSSRFGNKKPDNRLDRILSNTERILHLLQEIKLLEVRMDADIQAIIDQATANENAEAAADTALQSLFNKLTAAISAAATLSPADRATLQATVTAMKSSSSAVAAAIVANTPAA